MFTTPIKKKAIPKNTTNNFKILLIIVSFVVLFLALIAWLMVPSAENIENDESNPKTKKIATTKKLKEKKAPKAATNVVMRIKAKSEKPKERPPQRVGEIRDGYRLLCDGTLHRVLGVVTNTPGKFSIADKTFKHSADVELGNLLMVEPGDDLLGDTAGMYRGFNKEFDEALTEPIEYSDDDTPMQREMKQAVNELRKELKDRRAKGEDIEKIMEDTRNQLKELSLYRQELEDEVRKLSTDDLTQKDYEDLLAAANQMLSDRGIKPLEMPATLKHTLRLRQIQERAAEKAKEEKSNEK